MEAQRCWDVNGPTKVTPSINEEQEEREEQHKSPRADTRSSSQSALCFSESPGESHTFRENLLNTDFLGAGMSAVGERVSQARLTPVSPLPNSSCAYGWAGRRVLKWGFHHVSHPPNGDCTWIVWVPDTAFRAFLTPLQLRFFA